MKTTRLPGLGPTLMLLASCVAVFGCAGPAGTSQTASALRVAVFGASGRIGSHITREALDRGYFVTGVSRDRSRLEGKFENITIVEADILDRDALKAVAQAHDVLLVSIGGKPSSQVPAEYIAYRAAQSLIEVLGSLGDDGPRMIFVGNLFTLEYEDGKTLLDLGRVAPTHENYAMFYGHQLALDAFRASEGVNWTIASPPNGLRLKGRSGKVRWGGDELIRDADGKPGTISPEDFAFAVLEELEANRYPRQRFNVARQN